MCTYTHTHANMLMLHTVSTEVPVKLGNQHIADRRAYMTLWELIAQYDPWKRPLGRFQFLLVKYPNSIAL